MKRILLFILLFVSAFVMRAQIIPNLPPVILDNADTIINKMVGNWEWTKTCGGITGSCDSAKSVGYTQSIEFTKNTNSTNAIDYKKYKNDTLVGSGTYNLIYGSTIFSSTKKSWQYYGSSINTIINVLDSNTISFNANCYDCTGDGYKRIITIPSPQVTVNTTNWYDNGVICTIDDSTSGGTINWYSDSTLTTQIGTGNTFTYNPPYSGFYNIYATRKNGINSSLTTIVNISAPCNIFYATPAPQSIVVPYYKKQVALKGLNNNSQWYFDEHFVYVGEKVMIVRDYIDTGATHILQFPKPDTTLVLYSSTYYNPCHTADIQYTVNITNKLPLVNTTDTTINIKLTDSVDIAFINNASMAAWWQIASESKKGAIDTSSSVSYIESQNANCDGCASNIVITLKPKRIGIDTLVWNHYTNTKLDGSSKRIIVNVADTCPIVPLPIVQADTTIYRTPTDPVVYLTTNDPYTLTAKGTVIKWYLNAEGTNYIGSGSPFESTLYYSSSNTITVYATQTINGCESKTAKTTITIKTTDTNSVPAPVISKKIDLFAGSNVLIPVQDSVNGGIIHWYVLNQKISTGNVYLFNDITTALGCYAYKATRTIGTKTSSTTTFSVCVNSVPAPQIKTDTISWIKTGVSIIKADSINGSTVKWYSNATLTTLLNIGNTLALKVDTAGTYTVYSVRTIGGITSTVSKTTFSVNCGTGVSYSYIDTVVVPFYKRSILLDSKDSHSMWLINNKSVDSGATYTFTLPKADTVCPIYAQNQARYCPNYSVRFPVKITNYVPGSNLDTTYFINLNDTIQVSNIYSTLTHNSSGYTNSDSGPWFGYHLKRESFLGAIDTIAQMNVQSSLFVNGNAIFTLKAMKAGIDTLVLEKADSSLIHSTTLENNVKYVAGKKIMYLIFHIRDQYADTCPKIVMNPLQDIEVCSPSKTAEFKNSALHFSYKVGSYLATPTDTVYPANQQGFVPVGTYNISLKVNYSNGCAATAMSSVSVKQLQSPAMPQAHDYYFEPTETKLLTLDSTIDKNTEISWYCPTYGKVLFVGKTLDISSNFTTIGEYPFIVTALDSTTHCASKATFNVSIMNPASPSISGTVLANGTAYSSGSVQLFKLIGSVYEAVAAQPINADGTFLFRWLSANNYILRALPTENKTTYAPTYYVNATSWQDANTLSLKGKIIGLNLKLATYQSTSGTGSVTGNVAVLDSNLASQFKTFIPVQMTVLLLQNGKIVGYALTDIDGNYTIENVADGTYEVYVETPGYSKWRQTVVISNGSSENASFKLKNGVVTTDSNIESIEADAIVYPNPTNKELHVQFDNTIVKIEIINTSGIVIIESNAKTIDVSILPAGLYFVKIIGNDKTINKPFVKQ